MATLWTVFYFTAVLVSIVGMFLKARGLVVLLRWRRSEFSVAGLQADAYTSKHEGRFTEAKKSTMLIYGDLLAVQNLLVSAVQTLSSR